VLRLGYPKLCEGSTILTITIRAFNLARHNTVYLTRLYRKLSDYHCVASVSTSFIIIMRVTKVTKRVKYQVFLCLFTAAVSVVMQEILTIATAGRVVNVRKPLHLSDTLIAAPQIAPIVISSGGCPGSRWKLRMLLRCNVRPERMNRRSQCLSARCLQRTIQCSVGEWIQFSNNHAQ